MRQTAVEWLVEQLQLTRDFQRVINEVNQSSTSVRDVLEEAKEMEKEQIIDARIDGDTYSTAIKEIRTEYAEQYYKETYGGEK
jgi:hypothetical protein